MSAMPFDQDKITDESKLSVIRLDGKILCMFLI